MYQSTLRKYMLDNPATSSATLASSDQLMTDAGVVSNGVTGTLLSRRPPPMHEYAYGTGGDVTSAFMRESGLMQRQQQSRGSLTLLGKLFGKSRRDRCNNNSADEVS